MRRVCTTVMEHSQPQAQPEEEMSFEQRTSQSFGRDELWHFPFQALGQGLFRKGGGPAFPAQRLVVLCLVLLNVALLVAAAVLGIYCAKAKDLQIPPSVASPLMVELSYLRNQSNIIQDKLEVQATLMTERASHLQLKGQLKQQKAISDGLRRKIETLQSEKTKLQGNKTNLEQSCGRCPLGWILLKSTCYYFSKRESGSKKNWQDSRADCVSQGGDLLVINDLEEQQVISDNFPKIIGSIIWWTNGYWIGLTDAVTPGTWVWVNNVTETGTMYWKQGQPTLTGSLSGNCAAFYYYHDPRSTWYNGKCVEMHLNWICEMEPRQT